MKLIELIKEKLGVDPTELDADVDKETLKDMQAKLNEIADEIDQDEKDREAIKNGQESKEWAERIMLARQKKFNIAKARKLARDKRGMTYERATLLGKQGKLDQ